MKRYIRTKDGKIFDISKYLKRIEGFCEDLYDEYSAFDIVCERELGTKYLYIVKQADTIEELIEVGDLVRTCFCEEIYDIHLVEVLKDLITELYTKQGNDYILVAKKENVEWRIYEQ